ncbi:MULTISPECIES: phage virion morphogenesis protein [unclassified Pseudomonas]|uniref:phage virion morphogenesis protein n=1 Tax=unclassified Pseudomonas TaxID=196821 RepID=UPI000B871B96|nr:MULTISPECIES: phage virion morphogenesis protein [unclassified Pseudomonas]
MSANLETLEDWAAGLLGQLEPAARNKLARSIGQMLRRSQQQRIIAQRNPDESKYAPRKQRNLRGKQGRVRRKVLMFQKLRTTSFLKSQSDSNVISVGFMGHIAWIAKVHQYGLKDRAEHDAPVIKYETRGLLGFTRTELDLIRDSLLVHFNS